MGNTAEPAHLNTYKQQTVTPFTEIIHKGLSPKIRVPAPTTQFPKRTQMTYSSSFYLRNQIEQTLTHPTWYKVSQLLGLYPACTVGFIESWFGKDNYSRGTGFLISPKIVMTCARYLYNKDMGVPAKEVIFYPARRLNTGRKYEAYRIYYPQEYVESEDPKMSFFWDFGVITLQQSLSERYGYMGVSFDDTDFRPNQPKILIGYPHASEDVQLYNFQGSCSVNEEGYIKHDFPTEGSDTIRGGPILVQSGSETMVLGMHVGNFNGEGRGLKFTTRIYERLNLWTKEKRGWLKLGRMPVPSQINTFKLFSWQNLIHVDTSNLKLTGDGIRLMLQSQWTNLAILNLHNTQLGGTQLKLLSYGKWQFLSDLDMSSNKLKSEDVTQFKWSHWVNITKINLSRNKIDYEGLKIIIDCKWKRLRHLDISHNDIGTEGAKELSSSQWKQLEYLSLENCGIGGQGVYWLTKPKWKNIKSVNLVNNDIGDLGVGQLLQTAWFMLQSLWLNQNSITSSGLVLLIKNQWKQLKNISIASNLINRTAILLISKCSWQQLQILDCTNNSITEVDRQNIIQTLRMHLQNIKKILI